MVNPPSAKALRKLERAGYEQRLLFYFGREVEQRFGREVSEEMFAVARDSVNASNAAMAAGEEEKSS